MPDVHDAALIIYDYIEGFHEGLPGAGITQFLLSQATATGVAIPGTRARLATAMQAFDRIYDPHEAREDTAVFSAFRQIVPAGELAGLDRRPGGHCPIAGTTAGGRHVRRCLAGLVPGRPPRENCGHRQSLKGARNGL